MGHTISKEEIKPSKGRVDAIQNCRVPDAKCELQNLLALLGYCSKFIPNINRPTKRISKKNHRI